MGFSEEEVAAALDATKGSLERAADWLFVSRVEEEPEVKEASTKEAEADEEMHLEEFPTAPLQTEWEAELNDLCYMGFDETAAQQALAQHGGDLKQAVRTLVEDERKSKGY